MGMLQGVEINSRVFGIDVDGDLTVDGVKVTGSSTDYDDTAVLAEIAAIQSTLATTDVDLDTLQEISDKIQELNVRTDVLLTDGSNTMDSAYEATADNPDGVVTAKTITETEDLAILKTYVNDDVTIDNLFMQGCMNSNYYVGGSGLNLVKGIHKETGEVKEVTSSLGMIIDFGSQDVIYHADSDMTLINGHDYLGIFDSNLDESVIMNVTIASGGSIDYQYDGHFSIRRVAITDSYVVAYLVKESTIMVFDRTDGSIIRIIDEGFGVEVDALALAATDTKIITVIPDNSGFRIMDIDGTNQSTHILDAPIDEFGYKIHIDEVNNRIFGIGFNSPIQVFALDTGIKETEIPIPHLFDDNNFGMAFAMNSTMIVFGDQGYGMSAGGSFALFDRVTLELILSEQMALYGFSRSVGIDETVVMAGTPSDDGGFISYTLPYEKLLDVTRVTDLEEGSKQNLLIDGSRTLNSGYIPTNTLSIATKEYVDAGLHSSNVELLAPLSNNVNDELINIYEDNPFITELSSTGIAEAVAINNSHAAVLSTVENQVASTDISTGITSIIQLTDTNLPIISARDGSDLILLYEKTFATWVNLETGTHALSMHHGGTITNLHMVRHPDGVHNGMLYIVNGVVWAARSTTGSTKPQIEIASRGAAFVHSNSTKYIASGAQVNPGEAGLGTYTYDHDGGKDDSNETLIFQDSGRVVMSETYVFIMSEGKVFRTDLDGRNRLEICDAVAPAGTVNQLMSVSETHLVIGRPDINSVSRYSLDGSNEVILTSPNSVAGDNFGISVDVSGDTIIVGSSTTNAYMFDLSYAPSKHQTYSIMKANEYTDTQLSAATDVLTTLEMSANILKYTDEAGTETDIDLSLYLDDTNLARLTNGVLDSVTGIATFERDDATTFELDLSSLLSSTVASCFINQPVITSPINGTVDYTGAVESVYETSECFMQDQTDVYWEAGNSDFSTIYDSYTGASNLTWWTPSINMSATDVYVRTKQVSDKFYSSWGEAVMFTTPDIYVAKPDLTVEGMPASIEETPDLTGSAFTIVNGSDTHASTDWEIRVTSTGALLWSDIGSANLLTMQVPAGELLEDTQYTFRVRYNSTNNGSSIWEEQVVTTVAEFNKPMVIRQDSGLAPIVDEITIYFHEYGEGTTINWGDGSPDEDINAIGNWVHTYSVTGEYDIRITGSGGIKIGKVSTNTHESHFADVHSVISIDYGSFRFTNVDKMFDHIQTDFPLTGTPNIAACPVLDNMFYGLPLFNQDISTLDTSNATSIASMFAYSPSFNQSISHFDTSNVTSTSGLFTGASAFNQPLDNFNTSNVTDMGYMFYGANAFNQPVNHFNTDKVTYMSRMFSLCLVFNQPLTGFVTGTTTDLSSMFRQSPRFNQDVSGWDTSNVTRIDSMFYLATDFNHPVDSWDVSSVLYFGSTFGGTASFNQSLSSWHTTSAENMSGMFQDTISFNQPLDNFNTSLVTSMSRMFSGAKAFNQSLAHFNTSSCTSFREMFYEASVFNGSLLGWDTSNVTDVYYMFFRAWRFNQPVDHFVVSQLTTLIYMFFDADDFNQPLASWDVSNITTMTGMFHSTAFNQDISGWDVSSVTACNVFTSNVLECVNSPALPTSCTNCT